MGKQRYRQSGEKALMMKGLSEGGTDHTAFQRLRRSVVVHHATWSFSISCEQEAAEYGHLMGKVSENVKERE